MNLLAEFAQHWTTHLWSASLQVTLFIAFIYAVNLCFKRLPAKYRYILWLLVLVRLAVPTSITSPMGIGQYPERFLAGSIQWISEQQFLRTSQPLIPQKALPDTRREAMEAVGAPIGNPETLSPVAGSANDSVPLLCTIWLSGILVLVLAIAVRILLFRRRIRMLRPVARPDLLAAVHRLRERLDIMRPVSLLEARDADNVQFPSVHGILKPTIIMPAGMADGWTTEDLEPLLLHELTHIKRRDYLANFAQIVLQVLYFYHPVVWLANWIIRREREFACDDDVVRHSSGCPTAYVRSMLRIAETAANQRRHQLLGIAMADSSSNLGRRIRRMMNQGYRVNQQSGLIYLGVVFLLGLFCIAVSAQGPERPAVAAQMKSLVQESPNISSDGGSASSSGVLEPASENRIQTEPATNTPQSAPNAPVASMLHQVNSMDHPTDSSKASEQQIHAEIPYDGDRLVLTSDRQVKEGKILSATGNVVINFRDMVITSEEAFYDEEARRLSIRGQTKFSQGDAKLICSRAEFDFDAQNSTFYDASGSFYDTSGRQFFFSAGRVLKNGDNKFQMYKDSVIYERLQPTNPYAEDETLPVDEGGGTMTAISQSSVVPPDKALFKTGSEYLEKSQYVSARLAFQTLIHLYPDSDLAIPSYFAIGDSFYNEGGAENLLLAEDQYTNFIIFYPNHPKALDAKMKIISARMKEMRSPDRDRGHALSAEQELKSFLERFPDSDHAPIARKMLTEVQNFLVDTTTVAPSRKSNGNDSKEFFSKWLNEDVVYIISKEEREAFLSITGDEEKDSFITRFWQRRDPTPGTIKNEFREEHYSRIAYANEHFVSSIPGWKTDRGRIYIMWGKPGRIEPHPNGGVYNRASHEGGGTVRTYPFERWWYGHIDGIGNDIEIEFLDRSGSGEYRMAVSPDEKIIQSDDGVFGP